MQRERKLWEKVLALVLALVCCVGIINLSPLAQEAKAAGMEITSLSPLQVTAGEEFTFTATIKCGDTGRQFGSYNGISYSVNGVSKWCDEDWWLAAGASHDFTVTGSSDGSVNFKIDQPGDYTVTVATESNADRENTSKTFTLSVIAASGTVAQGTRPTNYTEKTDNNAAIGSWDNGAYSYSFTALDDSKFVNATRTDNPTKIAAASDDKLFVAPAVLYDYKESRSDKSNGSDIYTYNRDGQGNSSWGEPGWYNQFSNFDLALKREFYDVHTDITNKYYWMFVGACNTINGSDWPLTHLSQYGGSADEKASLWAANHNLNAVPSDATEDVFINDNTWRAAVKGLAGDRLNSKGNIVLGDTGYVMPYFDKDFLSQTFSYANGPMANIYENVLFPFRQTDDGYYEFRSYETAKGNEDNDNFFYNDGISRYTYGNNWCNNYNDNDDTRLGFFPFNTGNPVVGEGVDANDYKNFGNGVRVDIPFTLDPRTDGRDIVFKFAGDDDLWVYVDGYLALDLGGAHGMASGEINFSTQKSYAKDIATVNGKDITVAHDVYTDFPDELKAALTETSRSSAKKEHTLTVFYMERGLYDSNLHIQFNFTPIDYRQKNGLDVKNTVDLTGINPAFSGKIKEDDFSFVYTVADKSNTNVQLYANDTVTITGTAGVHSDLEQEVNADGSGSIRGDLMQVTQQENNMFTTSWSLYDTNGHTIMTNESSGLGNNYNVTDKKVNSDNFKLENKGGDGCDCLNGAEDSLLLTAQYVNRIKTTNVTIVTENAASANLKQDTDLYNFKVTVKKLSGVDVEDFDYEGDYEVVNKTTGEHIRDSHTVNGKFTISENEKIVIKNVPVNSEILVTEVETDGTKTTSEQGYVSTDATHTGTKLGDTDTTNSKSYTIGNDTENSYDWVIKNNKTTVQITEADKTFFAEVGTQIVLDKELGDYTVGSKNELGLTGLSAGQFHYTDTVDQPAYDETVPREINKSFNTAKTTDEDQNYKDITYDFGQTLAAGKEYTVTLSSTHGGDIILRTVTLGDRTIDAVSADKSGNIVTENLDGKDSVKSIDGSITFKFTPNTATSEIGFNLKTCTQYPFDLKITYNDVIHHEAGKVPVDKTIAYDYYEKVVEITSNMDASYGVPTTNTVNVTANGRTYLPGQIIYYTYPADKEPGEYDFTYKVQRVHAAPVSIGGNTVRDTGDPIDSITEVYDAKVYAYETNDDVYVIDYGLPVSLTAEPNDMRDNDKLDITGVDTISYERGFISGATTVNSGVYTYNNYSEPFTGSYGTVAEAAATNVSGDNNATLEPQYKYTLNKFMDGVETFYVGQQVVSTAVTRSELDASNATPVMNAKITVVPATVVYYEDDFNYSTDKNSGAAIIYTGNNVVYNGTDYSMKVQSNDKSELYGFDEAYVDQIQDSFGATKVTGTDIVSFTFKGTGFDIVGRSTKDSGVIAYSIVRNDKTYDEETNEYKDHMSLVEVGRLDTYYANGNLYQIPVISRDYTVNKDGSKNNNCYSEYTVAFRVFAPQDDDRNEFYFDGIRIYNPLGTNNSNYINSEKDATIKSIRDLILGDGEIVDSVIKVDGKEIPANDPYKADNGQKITVVGGAITEELSKPDGDAVSSASLAKMLSLGPNHEVYLGSGNHLAFWVTPDASVPAADRTLQVEAKAVATNNDNSTGAETTFDKTLWSFSDNIKDNNIKNDSETLKNILTDGYIPYYGDPGLQDKSTRWTAGLKRLAVGKYIQLDMGKVQWFDTIILALGGSTGDHPDGYKIEVSADGTKWTKVTPDGAWGQNGVSEYNVGLQAARYIKVTMTDKFTDDSEYVKYWSIYEFDVQLNTTTALKLTTNYGKNVIESISTSTAMYYKIPVETAGVYTKEDNGKYLVYIDGASYNGKNLSLSNIKCKGYTLEAYQPTIDSEVANYATITGLTLNTTNPEKSSNVTFTFTINNLPTGATVVENENLKVTGNGKAATMHDLQANGNTYTVTCKTANAVGVFVYSFEYTYEDNGKTVTTTASIPVTVGAGKARR